MRYLLIMALAITFQEGLSQSSLPNTDPITIPSGVSWKNGPGNAGGWNYNYGTKLTVWGNSTNRNFEVMNTNKDANSTLAFRTYNGNISSWTDWREFLFRDSNDLLRFSVKSFYSAAQSSFNGDFFLKSSNVAGINNYGAAISFSRVLGGDYKRAAIAAKQTGSDADNMGLSFFTHGDTSADDLDESMVITGAGNVGVGTLTPSAKLDVNGSIYMNSGLIQFYRTYEDYGNVLNIRTRDNNRFGDFRFEAEKTGNSTTKNLMFLDGDKGAVGVGTEDIPSGYALAVNGKVISEEVQVSLSGSWPDYVFEPNYKLRSLEEIEKFIQSNNHLPDVPSAAEVEENGIALGEMNALLLKKIEELTLHIIEQEKRIKKLERNGK